MKHPGKLITESTWRSLKSSVWHLVRGSSGDVVMYHTRNELETKISEEVPDSRRRFISPPVEYSVKRAVTTPISIRDLINQRINQ